MSLDVDFSPAKPWDGYSLADTLTATCELTLEQRVQLRHAWTPDPQKLWERPMGCHIFKRAQAEIGTWEKKKAHTLGQLTLWLNPMSHHSASLCSASLDRAAFQTIPPWQHYSGSWHAVSLHASLEPGSKRYGWSSELHRCPWGLPGLPFPSVSPAFLQGPQGNRGTVLSPHETECIQVKGRLSPPQLGPVCFLTLKYPFFLQHGETIINDGVVFHPEFSG